MRFAAAITLYNPSDGQISNCCSYMNSFDIIFILDNSEQIDDRIEHTFKDAPYVYIKMDGNEGLPKAFNKVLDSEIIEQFDYLCTLDQDSVFSSSDIDNMKLFIEECNLGKIAALDNNIVSIYAPIIDYDNRLVNEDGFEERKRVITSGSFINLSIIRTHKLRYDNNYFIDKFEIDLCQKMINLGYKIIVNHNSILKQSLGDGKKGTKSAHSALRHYYLFRNRLYFNHKYFGIVKRNFLNILQTGRHCMQILIYEDDKKHKMLQLPVAVKDYLKGNMGKKSD